MSETAKPVATKRIVIYGCSGCSDAGELADRTREPCRNKIAVKCLLAGIGGRVKSPW